MKKTAMVNEERCVACGACVKVCPKKAMEIIKGCFARPDVNKCVGCGVCAKECPADSIRIIEGEAAHE